MIELGGLSLACADPERMSAFWTEVLGDEAPLRFRAAAKTPTIEAPIHVDVNAPDPEAEVARLLELGARLVARKQVQIGPIEEGWTVLRDPEGNGFCVQGPDQRQGRAYLGNVTFSCAEPAKLAAFWREVLGYRETELPKEFERQLLEAGVDPAEFEAYADAVHPEGRRPRLLFQRRQKSPAPEPALRLELVADDVGAEAERLVALGATRRAEQTFLDPDGNAFLLGAR